MMVTRSAHLPAHALALLRTLRDTGAPSTEAALYRALFAAGLGVDEAARVLDSLLAGGLVVRVGRVAVMLTGDGLRSVEARGENTAGKSQRVIPFPPGGGG